MPKYTPGPWKAARVFADNAPDSFKVFTKPFGGTCVADCGDNEENAKLISAAPELLSACKQALDLIKNRFPEEHGCEDIGLAWGELEKAIAKAEGKD